MLFCIMSVAFFLRRKILRVIRHDSYLDLGNGSNSLGTIGLNELNQ